MHRQAGRIMHRGRYKTLLEIYEGVRASKEWRGAVPFENQTHRGLVLGTASIAILKELPPEPGDTLRIAYTHGRRP